MVAIWNLLGILLATDESLLCGAEAGPVWCRRTFLHWLYLIVFRQQHITDSRGCLITQFWVHHQLVRSATRRLWRIQARFIAARRSNWTSYFDRRALSRIACCCPSFIFLFCKTKMSSFSANVSKFQSTFKCFEIHLPENIFWNNFEKESCAFSIYHFFSFRRQ